MFLVLNLNGTKTLMGFKRPHAGFCHAQKLNYRVFLLNKSLGST